MALDDSSGGASGQRCSQRTSSLHKATTKGPVTTGVRGQWHQAAFLTAPHWLAGGWALEEDKEQLPLVFVEIHCSSQEGALRLTGGWAGSGAACLTRTRPELHKEGPFPYPSPSGSTDSSTGAWGKLEEESCSGMAWGVGRAVVRAPGDREAPRAG